MLFSFLVLVAYLAILILELSQPGSISVKAGQKISLCDRAIYLSTLICSDCGMPTTHVAIGAKLRRTMEKVQSSNIAGWDYYDEEKELWIYFRSGKYCYRYREVEKDVKDGLEKAISKGKFFNREIKNNYKHEKIRL